ncbi:diguanylate cyclase (GGDEF)-like protein [Paenibacillus phyllosphaerae]|uniref:Diguanylate cyclase (GGDEF)-like protein n=1 Tax=Paenibacillus phyllosphaerae TaxID=274593 RepID=A0A7W5AZA9_9BACL|nr:diguanylate cyclase [Paenibacillus phyllosphaerae]MBB3111407.1 diguanylate cyclase (GGDEF)-like protein [Paenibacillus phyllosphaerae]
MAISSDELLMYRKFEELADDILQMANEIMPDKLLFVSAITDTHQLILKVLDNNTGSLISEGMTVELTGTVCRRVDFENRKPLIYEDMSKEPCLEDVRETLQAANVNSYVGVPIVLQDGQVFGTICAVHPAAATIDAKSVQMFQRISKMFAYYLELERMAFRDTLTGLYNRQYLFNYFSELPGSGAIFFLDLDGFKKVNDLHGHEAGDLVLKEVAYRIDTFMKELPGFAARLGGDEFVLVFSDAFEAQQLEGYASDIIDRLSTWNIHLEAFQLSVSVGIVKYTAEDSGDLKLLLKNADNALYRAKAAGRKTYRFFE